MHAHELGSMQYKCAAGIMKFTEVESFTVQMCVPALVATVVWSRYLLHLVLSRSKNTTQKIKGWLSPKQDEELHTLYDHSLASCVSVCMVVYNVLVRRLRPLFFWSLIVRLVFSA